MVGVAALALSSTGTSADGLSTNSGRFAVMVVSYLLYFAAFLGVSIAVSARVKTNERKDAVKVKLDYQVEPGGNTHANENKEAYLALDKTRLYLAFYAYDSNPQASRTPCFQAQGLR